MTCFELLFKNARKFHFHKANVRNHLNVCWLSNHFTMSTSMQSFLYEPESVQIAQSVYVSKELLRIY